MDVKDLIVDLRARGASFEIKAGGVHIDAPHGVLTEETLKTLAAWRGELWAHMVDLARHSWEKRRAWQRFEYFATGLLSLRDRDDDGSEEYAKLHRELQDSVNESGQRLAEIEDRYEELERPFGPGYEYKARAWLNQLEIEPPEQGVDADGNRREIVRL